jgi:hypothetical protein
MHFELSPKLTKQISKYEDKHQSFEEDFTNFKKLLSQHFDKNDPFEFSKKMLIIDPNIKYRTVYKFLGIAVQNLSKNQSPRLWFKLENNQLIFLLFMDDHTNNYKETKCVKIITEILKEMEL